MAFLNTFEELNCWKKGREIRRMVSKNVCSRLPKHEKYGLQDQLIRTSRSVTANIAEGFGRYHFKDSIRFLMQARGSLYELIDHLSVCVDEGYLSKDEYANFKSLIFDNLRLLNGFQRYLKNRHSEDKSTN